MMKSMTWMLVASFLMIGTAFADVGVTEGAAADDGAYPVHVADRPLTFTQGTLNVDVSFGVTSTDLGTLGSSMSDTFTVGVAYGILDDLQVSLVQPLTFGMFDTAFDAHDMTLGATYRFMDGDFEMGASLDLNIPIVGAFGLAVGVPMAYHMGMARLRTGVQFGISDLGGANGMTLGVPLAVDLSVWDNLYLGVGTGFAANVEDFGNSWAIPLNATVGYTFGGDAPVADLQAVFALPSFATTDGVGADIWTAGLQGRFYIGL